MKIDILTLFPKIYEGPFKESIIGKAAAKGLVRINIHDLREFVSNQHGKADDRPYGGGPGMVMKPEPVFEAVEHIIDNEKADNVENYRNRVILMSPRGDIFTQQKAKELANDKHLIFICGRYEGIDERVKKITTEELSIGDYVITGGELASMVVIDAVIRLMPGVLGDDESALQDSFSEEMLDHPHYTRPAVYRDIKVPEILRSGNHKEIKEWRRRAALRQTFLRRPDLLSKAELTDNDKKFIEELKEKEKHE